MSTPLPTGPSTPESGPVLELYFSPKELVKSALRIPGEETCEFGVKGREVRWQQGTIAVCLLLVLTRLRALEGTQETPVLEGEQGSPARSIDNLLNKPGDWTLHMFGETKGGIPRIRELIYRKRTVSRSNPVSAVQWDAEKLPPQNIRIWQAEQELTDASALRELIRTLLEAFNPRRAAREWDFLFPEPLPPSPSKNHGEGLSSTQDLREEAPSSIPASPTVLPPPTLPPQRESTGEQKSRSTSLRISWRITLLLLVVLGMGITIGKNFSPGGTPPKGLASAKVVEEFISALDSGNLDAAFALTSPRYQETVSRRSFEIAFGQQRYNFPRLAGNPFRNTETSLTHDYRVTLYVETRVQRVPALEGLSRIPLTRFDQYAARIDLFIRELAEHGIEPALLNQLSKERLERPDASRHIQLVCGLSNEEIVAIYPEEMATTLDLTLFFELLREPATGKWQIHSIEDASERLVAF